MSAGMLSHPRGSLSATAETLNSSGAPVPYGYLTICNNHRNLTLTPAMPQHFFHSVWIKLHVIIDMLRNRLTGARGMGSALLSVNNLLAHVAPLNV
jgi:hypothetical protein